jgi:hypothetical protein
MNANFSFRDNIDADSIITEERDPQSQKHSSPKNSIDEGRMISLQSVSKNAHFSIRDSFDSDSNTTEESDPHNEKHSKSKTSLAICLN